MSRHTRVLALLDGMITTGCATTLLPVERAEEVLVWAQRQLGADPTQMSCRVLPNRTAPITLKEYYELDPSDRRGGGEMDQVAKDLAARDPATAKKPMAERRFWYIYCRTKAQSPVLDGTLRVYFDAETGRAQAYVY